MKCKLGKRGLQESAQVALAMGVIAIIAIVALVIFFNQQQAAVSPEPSRRTTTDTGTFFCGDDGLADTIIRAEYFDKSNGLWTLAAVNYREYQGDSGTPKASGTTSATADTTSGLTNNLNCGETAHVIVGNSNPNGGYYFTDSGTQTVDSAGEYFATKLRTTGDLRTIQFDSSNGSVGTTTVQVAFDIVGGENRDVTLVLEENVTNGYYSWAEDGQDKILVTFEYLSSNFSQIRIDTCDQAGVSITQGSTPANYTLITTGKITESWEISGLQLYNGKRIKCPIVAKAQAGVNPSDGGATGWGTNVSVTIADWAPDIQNGKLVYGFVNQTTKTNDIGAPNRAAANAIRYA